jgi:NitT/TauT family transport system substrate-binding protein
MNSRFPLAPVYLAALLTLASCQQDPSTAPGGSETGSADSVASSGWAGIPSPTAPGTQAAPAVERSFRIAFTPGLGSLPVYVARQRRWFEDRGFTVTYAEAQADSNACLDRLAAGDADVAFGVSLQAVFEAETKKPGTWRILGFAAETRENPVGTFLVPMDSPVKSVEELKGRRIVAAGADYAPRMAEIALTGGKGSVEGGIPLVRIAPGIAFEFKEPDGPEALFAVGEVMAGLTKGLPGERTMRSIAPAPLASSRFSPFPVQAVVIREALVRKDPVSVGKLSEACAGLLEWCNQGFAESLPLIQKEFTLDDESTLNIFPPVFLSPGEIPVENLIRAAELWTGGPIPEAGHADILSLVRHVGSH